MPTILTLIVLLGVHAECARVAFVDDVTENETAPATRHLRAADRSALEAESAKRSPRTSAITEATALVTNPNKAKRKSNPRESATIEQTTESSTRRPEDSLRIMINGTTNCSTRLSDATADVMTDASDDVFTINVTSSLRANATHAIPASVISVSGPDEGDYDYDYGEATLPPSLPNLKIIPFVAADAVLGEKGGVASARPSPQRDDRFPVYYHNAGRREDAPLDGATAASHVEAETRTIGVFSPPVETQGGFVPKTAPVADDPHSASPSTSPPLTTSMLLDTAKEVQGGCVTGDDRRRLVDDGDTAVVGCALCECVRTRLRCAPLERCLTVDDTPATMPPSDATIADVREELVTTTTEYNKTTSDTPHTPEYEEEDEDDGFSFGNVLELLLSDTYDSTEAATALTPPSDARQPPENVGADNKIDHLVLGESQSIKRPYPATRTPLPMSSERPPTTAVTQPTATTDRPTASGPPEAGVTSSGVFKLAGCNIYGKMHPVGSAIPELSSECDTCRCTQLGVHCTKRC